MKNLVLVTLMAMIMVVGCGSESVKPATLSSKGEETVIQETILEENTIEEIETWDGSNVKRWD